MYLKLIYKSPHSAAGLGEARYLPIKAVSLYIVSLWSPRAMLVCDSYVRGRRRLHHYIVERASPDHSSEDLLSRRLFSA